MKKAIFLLSICLLFSCNNAGKDETIVIKPHDYKEIEHLKINWSDTLNYTGKYFVYYFTDHCAHCYEIKNEVITYALKGSNKIYFCNDTRITYFEGDVIETIGKSNIDEAFINGTPSIIEVDEGIIKDNVCGTNKVLKKIRGE